MSISLTPAAAERVRQFLAEQPGAIAMRFGVKRMGCSGYAYEVELSDRVGSDDAVFEQQGVRVVVAREHLPFVEGTEIDFVRSVLGSEFQFRNPRVTAQCGCGESFTIDPAHA